MADRSIRPGIARQPPSVDYIDNKLPACHAAFDNRHAKYDLHLDKYVPAQDKTNKNEIFQNAMDILKEKENEPAQVLDHGYSIRSKTTWDAVYSQLERALLAYKGVDANNKPNKGLKDCFKRGYRSAADHSEPVRQFTKMIPSSDIVTPVLAAVGIILDACQAASETREKVTKAFEAETLDRQFAEIDEYLDLFPDDQAIKTASLNLVVATLKAVEHSIEFFVGSPGLKVPKAIVGGQKLYKKALKASLDEIQACSNTLLRDANRSHMRQTIHNGQRVNQKADIIINNGMQLSGNVADIKNMIKVLFDEGEKLKRLNIEAQKRYIQMQEENEKLRIEHNRRSSTSQTPPYTSPPAYYFTLSNLCHILQIPDIQHLHHHDVHSVLRHSDLIPAQHRGKTQQVILTPQFREWAVSQTWRELLIHGDFPLDGSNISALSLLCATLMQNFRSRNTYISVVFFCGCHDDREDLHTGAKIIMKSLIAQLLEQYVFNPSHLPYEVNLVGVQNGEMYHLCALFACLLRQLPPDHTVACLIDGAVYYEKDEYEEEMLYVLDFLLELLRSRTTSAPIKLLLTSPSPTDSVRERFVSNDESFLALEGQPGLYSDTYGLRLTDSDHGSDCE